MCYLFKAFIAFIIWYCIIWFIAYTNLPFEQVGKNLIEFGWFAKILIFFAVLGTLGD